MSATRRSRSASVALAVALTLPTTAMLAISAGPATAVGDTRCTPVAASRWTALRNATAGVIATALDDVDPCQLVQTDGTDVFLSSDRGRHFSTSELPAHGPVTGLVTEGLGPNAVLLSTDADAAEGAPGGLFLSTDAGRSFASVAPGLQGVQPLSVAVAPGAGITESDAATVFLLGRTTKAPQPDPGSGSDSVLFVSTDSAQTFRPVWTAATGADRVVVDPTDPAVLWVNGRRAGSSASLWRSTDGGQTFDAVVVTGATSVSDISLALRPDGVVLVYVATDAGVLLSDTDGLRWRRLAGSVGRSTAVRTAASDANGVMAVIDGHPVRGGEPQPLRPATDGLPAHCRAAVLAATTVHPTVFATACGHTRYVIAPITRTPAIPVLPGDAGSPAGAGNGRGPRGPGSSSTAALVGVPLTPVQTWQLPDAVIQTGSTPASTLAGESATSAQTSGTLAFDGRVLYYLPSADQGENADNQGGLKISRIDARTGQPVAALVVKLGNNQRVGRTTLDFDARRNLLYINTSRGVPGKRGQYARLVAYDVHTKAVRSLFTVPPSKNGVNLAPWVKYDALHDNFILVEEGGFTLSHLDRTGRVLDTCSWYDTAEQQAATSQAAGAEPNAGAVATAGDGGAYVQLEDDSTVLRLTANCTLVQTYKHRRFSESFGEDDDLACDSQTFGLPALWVRDAAVGTVTAYAAPGYCPLASELTIAAPAAVSTGQAAPICAILRLHGLPIAGQRVSLNVDGQELAFTPTDAVGRACTTYTAGKPGSVPVDARYFGARDPRKTPQYLPSSASAVLAISATGIGGLPVPAAGLAPPVAPGGQAPPAARPVTNPQPQPQPQVQQQVQQQTQQQAQQQSQGQTQQQVGVQGGLVAQREQQIQLAYADTYDVDTDYSMSLLDQDENQLALLCSGFLLAAVTSAVALSRHPVRGADQPW